MSIEPTVLFRYGIISLNEFQILSNLNPTSREEKKRRAE